MVLTPPAQSIRGDKRAPYAGQIFIDPLFRYYQTPTTSYRDLCGSLFISPRVHRITYSVLNKGSFFCCLFSVGSVEVKRENKRVWNTLSMCRRTIMRC